MLRVPDMSNTRYERCAIKYTTAVLRTTRYVGVDTQGGDHTISKYEPSDVSFRIGIFLQDQEPALNTSIFILKNRTPHYK